MARRLGWPEDRLRREHFAPHRKGDPEAPLTDAEVRADCEAFRGEMASVRTDDQRKVYQEMGKPDRIRNVQYPGHLESSWWYFESGRVYRFRDGRLEQVVPFDPVRGL